MTHGVTNTNSNYLARLVGEVSTVQSLPLIPSGYALTASPAGTSLPADVQITSKPAVNTPTSAATAFDTAIVSQNVSGFLLELAA